MCASSTSRSVTGRLCASLRRAATLGLACVYPLVAQAAPGDLELIGVTPAGASADGHSSVADVSADAHFVVFHASDSGIVAGDTNGKVDLFVRDRQMGVSKRLTISASGQQANADTFEGRITPDGRYVVFSTIASNLVPNDTNVISGGPYDGADVFVHDRQSGALELVSLAPNGQQPDGRNLSGSISDDGRFVAFMASGRAVFVRDRQAGTTQRVNVNSAGVPSNSEPGECDISGDGRYVAFVDYGSNLVANDTNGEADVFVRDRQTGVTERVSLMTNGGQFTSYASFPAISRDGRYVAFEVNGLIWVRDRWTDTTEPVSVSSAEVLPNRSSHRPSISADGRYVTFESFAANLVAGDTNDQMDVFRRDRTAGTTQIVSRDDRNSSAAGASLFGSISPDGRFVGFGSGARLVPADSDTDFDAYLAEVSDAGLYAFTVKPRALSFGPQVLFTSRTRTFWLRNTGGQVLPIQGVFLDGRNPGQFAVTHGCGASVAVGSACAIRVTFTPTSLGDKTAWVRVTAGDHTTRSRAVSGTGVTAIP